MSPAAGAEGDASHAVPIVADLVKAPPPRPAPAGELRRVAVIDCGTSAVRAYIAEVGGKEPRVLEDLRHPIDLTPSFTAEKLTREGMDGVERAFTGIMQAARDNGVSVVRAVATSALRESANSDVLIERLRARLGVDLEIIDSGEEARLYFEALRGVARRCGQRLPGNTLLIDLGGGSTSVSVIRGGKLVHSVDEHYGTVRLYDQFKDLKDSTDYAITVQRYSLGVAKMMLGRLHEKKFTQLVVTGGEVRRLQALLAGDASPVGKWSMDPLPAAPVGAWFRSMQDLTPTQRAELCHCDEQSAALLLPAGCLINHLCGRTGIDHVLVPQFNLRDGMIADLMPGALGPHHLDPDHLLAEALQLVERYGGDLEYSQNTASLATQIFDQTVELHGLGARERALLEFSALVHDIGSFINVRNRHKHTMYVIQSADIAGLSRIEKELVANIARYHRRGQPQSHHAGFQALPRAQRVVVSSLAAILRLAYGLDVERTQRIKSVRCARVGARLLMHVDTRQIALERWSIAGKAQLFAEVFGLEVMVVPREEE